MYHYVALFALARYVVAQYDGDEYITSLCLPQNSTGYPDYNAPCNVAAAIQLQCSYGTDNFNPLDPNADIPEDAVQPTFDTQRICLCESEFFDQSNGCATCFAKHGSQDPAFTALGGDALSTFSSSYCAATYTPTADLPSYLYAFAESVAPSTATAEPSSFSNPLGNMTQVSLYYTARVTGSSAWVVAEPTGTATYTSANTVDGQIRPTAESAGGGSGDSSTTTSGNAAMRTEAVAAAGIIGFVGAVVLL